MQRSCNICSRFPKVSRVFLIPFSLSRSNTAFNVKVISTVAACWSSPVGYTSFVSIYQLGVPWWEHWVSFLSHLRIAHALNLVNITLLGSVPTYLDHADHLITQYSHITSFEEALVWCCFPVYLLSNITSSLNFACNVARLGYFRHLLCSPIVLRGSDSLTIFSVFSTFRVLWLLRSISL